MAEIPYEQLVFTALPLLAFIINMSFGIFIFRRKRILVNRLFTLLMFAFCWWSIGDFALRIATGAATKAAGILMLKFINMVMPCIPPIALAFVMALENKRPSKRQLAAMVVLSLTFIAIDLTGFLINKPPEPKFGVLMIPDMSGDINIHNGYIYLTIYMVAFTLYVVYRLISFYRNCENAMVKNRIRYLLIGAFITTIITFTTEFLVPFGLLKWVGFDIPSLGSLSTIFLTSLTYYSVRSR